MRLRNNKEAGPFPDEEDDTDLPFFEAQLCAAQADPDDEMLKVLALYTRAVKLAALQAVHTTDE